MSSDGKSVEDDLPVVSTRYPSGRGHGQSLSFASSSLAPRIALAPRGCHQGYHALDHRSVAETTYQPRGIHLGQRPSSQLFSRRLPVVQSYSPAQGSTGTTVTVQLYTIYDPERPPFAYYTLMFGSKGCDSSLTKLDAHGQYLRYLLAAAAPPFSSTGWVDQDVPIYLRVGDESGQSVGTVEVGNFMYHSPRPELTYEPAPITVRKRKSSVELDPLTIPTKRPSHQDLRSRSSDEVPTFSYSAAEGSLYQPYLQVEDAGNASPAVADYASPQGPFTYRSHASPRALSYPYSNASTVPVLSPETASPRAPSWSSAYSDVSSQPSHSPAVTAATCSTRPSIQQLAPSSVLGNPSLIRTSTIQQSSSSVNAAIGGSQARPAFNPYAMYPHKAVLKIQGDLDSMAENWGLDEWDAKRRLVRFQRQQSGNTIHAGFQPVAPSERPANSICISCIWWEEKKECYVTSVDTIYLLESLVAVRFTVEEKNRIRRNLEGFRPLTVSKGKADSEEFFKVIMGFPAPKPRNIEKDVKVFPWKILAHALKKIIGKYSASYSSTAGALSTAVSPSSYGSGGSGTGGLVKTNAEYSALASPHDAMGPQTYRGRVASTSLSPNVQHATASLSSLGDGELRLTYPHMRPPSIRSSPGRQTYVGPAGRASWDLGPFLQPGSAMGMAEGGATVNYVGASLTPADEATMLPSQRDPSISRA